MRLRKHHTGCAKEFTVAMSDRVLCQTPAERAEDGSTVAKKTTTKLFTCEGHAWVGQHRRRVAKDLEICVELGARPGLT